MFESFPHKADIGIRAKAKTIEETFCEAAKALFSVMADIKAVKPKKDVSFEVKAEALDLLLVEWLNSLLSIASLKNMLFSEFKVTIEKKNKIFYLNGQAKGEKINFKKHNIITEVKAATYSGLKFEKQNSEWFAQCILDV